MWLQAVLDLQLYNMHCGLVPWFTRQPGRRRRFVLFLSMLALPFSCMIRTGPLAQSYGQDKRSLLRRMGVTCVAPLRFVMR